MNESSERDEIRKDPPKQSVPVSPSRKLASAIQSNSTISVETPNNQLPQHTGMNGFFHSISCCFFGDPGIQHTPVISNPISNSTSLPENKNQDSSIQSKTPESPIVMTPLQPQKFVVNSKPASQRHGSLVPQKQESFEHKEENFIEPKSFFHSQQFDPKIYEPEIIPPQSSLAISSPVSTTSTHTPNSTFSSHYSDPFSSPDRPPLTRHNLSTHSISSSSSSSSSQSSLLVTDLPPPPPPPSATPPSLPSFPFIQYSTPPHQRDRGTGTILASRTEGLGGVGGGGGSFVDSSPNYGPMRYSREQMTDDGNTTDGTSVIGTWRRNDGDDEGESEIGEED